MKKIKTIFESLDHWAEEKESHTWMYVFGLFALGIGFAVAVKMDWSTATWRDISLVLTWAVGTAAIVTTWMFGTLKVSLHALKRATEEGYPTAAIYAFCIVLLISFFAFLLFLRAAKQFVGGTT